MCWVLTVSWPSVNLVILDFIHFKQYAGILISGCLFLCLYPFEGNKKRYLNICSDTVLW